MTDDTTPEDPWPRPTRRERRGLFPEHTDRPRRVLTLAEARTIARDRLDRWRSEHE